MRAWVDFCDIFSQLIKNFNSDAYLPLGITYQQKLGGWFILSINWLKDTKYVDWNWHLTLWSTWPKVVPRLILPFYLIPCHHLELLSI